MYTTKKFKAAVACVLALLAFSSVAMAATSVGVTLKKAGGTASSAWTSPAYSQAYCSGTNYYCTLNGQGYVTMKVKARTNSSGAGSTVVWNQTIPSSVSPSTITGYTNSSSTGRYYQVVLNNPDGKLASPWATGNVSKAS